MKIEEIYTIESTNNSAIHLVRDRLFWQAWEKSAFIFVKLFRTYKVHSKFVQKICSEMVWLGFPKNNLEQFQSEATKKGLRWSALNENHIVIAGCPKYEGFELWKKDLLANAKQKSLQTQTISPSQINLFDTCATKASSPTSNVVKDESLEESNQFLLYRKAYDFCLEIFELTTKVSKNYKFGLADKIHEETLQMVELVHLKSNGLEMRDKTEIYYFATKLRIKLRLLNDLKQISMKKWISLNNQLEDLLKFSGQSFQVQGPGK